jgi:hypothetical protein
MRFSPSQEMLEAIRRVTGVDPFDDPGVILKALRDPALAPEIERLYAELKADDCQRGAGGVTTPLRYV